MSLLLCVELSWVLLPACLPLAGLFVVHLFVDLECLWEQKPSDPETPMSEVHTASSSRSQLPAAQSESCGDGFLLDVRRRSLT